jgi:hypothetical protein
MLKNSEDIILPNNSAHSTHDGISYLHIKEERGFFIKVINALKSLKPEKMDYHICESLYIYRIKYIMEKNQKNKNERKSTLYDSYYSYEQNIEEVISKLFKLFEVDGQILIVSLYVLESFIYKSKTLLDENNYIKLIVISLMETIKFYIDDSHINVKLICAILKIDKDILVNMECYFLNSINYKLKIDEEKFHLYKKKIMLSWIEYLKKNI